MSRARMWSIPGLRSGEVSAHLSIASSWEGCPMSFHSLHDVGRPRHMANSVVTEASEPLPVSVGMTPRLQASKRNRSHALDFSQAGQGVSTRFRFCPALRLLGKPGSRKMVAAYSGRTWKSPARRKRVIVVALSTARSTISSVGDGLSTWPLLPMAINANVGASIPSPDRTG